VSELDERRQHLTALVEANRETIARLGREGIQIDPQSVLAMRLDLLINHFMPPGSPERLEFDVTCETVFGESLARAGEQATRARLLQGVHMGPQPNVPQPS